jgi:hypothetical protein
LKIGLLLTETICCNNENNSLQYLKICLQVRQYLSAGFLCQVAEREKQQLCGAVLRFDGIPVAEFSESGKIKSPETHRAFDCSSN